MTTFEFDVSEWNRKAEALFQVVQRDFGGRPEAFLADETAKLVKQIVAFTPPLGPGGRNAGAKQAGEQAIEKEMKSLFSEADTLTIDEIGSEHGLKAIDTFIYGKNKELIHVQWTHLDPNGARIEEFHKRFKNHRGKVPLRKQQKGTWSARVVIPKGMRQPYIDKLKERVGRWRASIARVLPAIGRPVPNWISRHFGKIYDITILDLSQLTHPTQPSITFGSRAPGIEANYQNKIKAAVRTRTKAMGNRARLILSGYAKDVTAGLRARSRTQETATAEPGGMD